MLIFFEVIFDDFFRILLLIVFILFFIHKNMVLLGNSILIIIILKIITGCYNFYNKFKCIRNKKAEFSEEYMICDVSVFPSGNILLITSKVLKILNNQLKLLQKIDMINTYENLDIKDENNFLIISSKINQIKTYIKENNIFKYNKSIGGFNNLQFAKYFPNDYLVSVCKDELFIFKEYNLD